MQKLYKNRRCGYNITMKNVKKYERRVAFGLLLIVLSVISFFATFVVPYVTERKQLQIWLWVAVTVLFLIGFVTSICAKVHAKQAEREAYSQSNAVVGAITNYGDDYVSPQSFMPQVDKEKQTVTEKLQQMAQMDHTQLVCFMAKLYSYQGYSVKLTPVVDNFGVDFITEGAQGQSAVFCMHSQEVTAEELAVVPFGVDNYPVERAIAVTCGTFDRSAKKFAKRNKITLVDKKILASKFL